MVIFSVHSLQNMSLSTYNLKYEFLHFFQNRHEICGQLSKGTGNCIFPS